MSLIYSDTFEPLFSPFSGMRIGYVQLDGNVGDWMIRDATVFLLKCFKISFIRISADRVLAGKIPEDVDELVVSGGGNLGTFYTKCHRLRRATLECGLPVTLLPQSFVTYDEDLSPFKRVYVRERESQAVDPSFVLMPDLALGHKDVDFIEPPTFDLGVFLREDKESLFEDRSLSLVDPVTNNPTVRQYIELASRFAHVVTDRLHFAIASLLAGRRTTLLPNSTGKNLAMYATWLADLGCEMLPDPGSLRYDTEAVKEALWARLAPVPEEALPWHAVCGEADTLEPEVEGERAVFRDEEGQTIARVDENAFTVWALCDGQRRVEDVATAIAKIYDKPRADVAAAVASTVTSLHRAGILLRERREILVEVLPDSTRDDWVYRRAAVLHPDRQRTELWFAVPAKHASHLSGNADCFVISMIMQAMFQKLPLRLRNGTVSPGLLENLTQFQEHWKEWRATHAFAEIEADVGGPDPAVEDGVIAAFSGGLDSCYTLSAHNKAGAGGLPRIEAVVMAQGFDIPVTDARGFAGALARARPITDEAGVVVLPVRTNFRGVHFDGHWEDRHATALAAVLTVCSRGCSAGIVSSTMNVGFPATYGSNPLTDPLLGSDRFAISHFGFEASRLQKFRALSEWPAAIDNLRVCWKYEHRDRNCGRCYKCVIALLSLRCLGLSTACFTTPPDDQELAALVPDKYSGGLNVYDLRELAASVRDQGIDTPWSRRLEELYDR